MMDQLSCVLPLLVFTLKSGCQTKDLGAGDTSYFEQPPNRPANDLTHTRMQGQPQHSNNATNGTVLLVKDVNGIPHKWKRDFDRDGLNKSSYLANASTSALGITFASHRQNVTHHYNNSGSNLPQRGRSNANHEGEIAGIVIVSLFAVALLTTAVYLKKKNICQTYRRLRKPWKYRRREITQNILNPDIDPPANELEWDDDLGANVYYEEDKIVE